MYCGNCGSQMPDISKFCHKCGTPLRGQKTNQPSPVPTRGHWEYRDFSTALGNVRLKRQ